GVASMPRTPCGLVGDLGWAGTSCHAPKAYRSSRDRHRAAPVPARAIVLAFGVWTGWPGDAAIPPWPGIHLIHQVRDQAAAAARSRRRALSRRPAGRVR